MKKYRIKDKYKKETDEYVHQVQVKVFGFWIPVRYYDKIDRCYYNLNFDCKDMAERWVKKQNVLENE